MAYTSGGRNPYIFGTGHWEPDPTPHIDSQDDGITRGPDDASHPDGTRAYADPSRPHDRGHITTDWAWSTGRDPLPNHFFYGKNDKPRRRSWMLNESGKERLEDGESINATHLRGFARVAFRGIGGLTRLADSAPLSGDVIGARRWLTDVVATDLSGDASVWEILKGKNTHTKSHYITRGLGFLAMAGIGLGAAGVAVGVAIPAGIGYGAWRGYRAGSGALRDASARRAAERQARQEEADRLAAEAAAAAASTGGTDAEATPALPAPPAPRPRRWRRRGGSPRLPRPDGDPGDGDGGDDDLDIPDFLK